MERRRVLDEARELVEWAEAMRRHRGRVVRTAAMQEASRSQPPLWLSLHVGVRSDYRRSAADHEQAAFGPLRTTGICLKSCSQTLSACPIMGA